MFKNSKSNIITLTHSIFKTFLNRNCQILCFILKRTYFIFKLTTFSVIQTYLNSFLILRCQHTNDVRFVFNLNYLSYLLTLFVFVYNFDYVCIMTGFTFRSSLYSNVPFKPTHSLVVSPHIYMQVYILYLQVTCVCFVDRVLS
jgi:hypothetical protein